MRFADRETALRWALLLPIPFAPPLLWVVEPAHVAGTSTIAWLALIGVSITAAPLAGLGRSEAGGVAALAVCATVFAGYAWLYLAFLSLCTFSTLQALLAIAIGVLPYLAFGALALRSDEAVSRVLGLPLAIVAGFVLSTIALAIMTGGPHYCPT
jgi:hypothetical protein